jgi:hypothetical protein
VRISHGWVPRPTGLAALLAVAAGCQPSPALEFDASATDGAGSDGAPDAGVCGDRFASSSMPLAPCLVDSDCHSAYLFCGPPLGTVTFCRDADAAVDECAAPAFANPPMCPAVTFIRDNLCGIRYQRPCKDDSDCGPGFTCDSSGASSSTCPTGSPAGTPCGRCQAPPFAACVTKADCPKEWDCNAGCGCTPDAQTYCFPPFEIFRCPNCAPIPGP